LRLNPRKVNPAASAQRRPKTTPSQIIGAWSGPNALASRLSCFASRWGRSTCRTWGSLMLRHGVRPKYSLASAQPSSARRRDRSSPEPAAAPSLPLNQGECGQGSRAAAAGRYYSFRRSPLQREDPVCSGHGPLLVSGRSYGFVCLLRASADRRTRLATAGQ
jgi:hypothetical protein